MTYLLMIVKLTDAVVCYTIHIYNDILNANLYIRFIAIKKINITW